MFRYGFFYVPLGWLGMKIFRHFLGPANLVKSEIKPEAIAARLYILYPVIQHARLYCTLSLRNRNNAKLQHLVIVTGEISEYDLDVTCIIFYLGHKYFAQIEIIAFITVLKATWSLKVGNEI